MASGTIKISTAAMGLALVIATELLGWWIIKLSDAPLLAVTGILRIIQITAVGWIVVRWEGGLYAIGCARDSWLPGVKKGAVWSMGFGAVTAIAMAGIYLSGQNPFQMVKSPLPSKQWELVLFFVVGGFIAPVAEEFCFRGIVYTFFRRWGVLIALFASTTLFVVLHTVHGIPVIQIVGGIVFAIAYESSGKLMVPITIHCLANTAIFTLSLL